MAKTNVTAANARQTRESARNRSTSRRDISCTITSMREISPAGGFTFA
jgi:hypothetical protein